MRQYHFVIATSTDSGTTYTKMFGGHDSGTTLYSKKYTIPDTGVRFVREIVNGNTSSTRDSILELDLSRALVYDALYELMLSH